MPEWFKTIAYLAVGVAILGFAAASEWMSRPQALQEFEQVGDLFYPEFEDPLRARSLEVAAYDPDTSVIHEFAVRWQKNGWTISPYGYPADAEDQLEKTAASVVGIRRDGFASRRESDHERFGVIDPTSEDVTKLQGRGDRITLMDESNQILVDLIIGDPVEGRPGYFYVRKPKENDTYISQVDLNLSTRFSDWINTDLLGIDVGQLRDIVIQDYSIDADRGTAEMRDRSHLHKEDSASPWDLEGLNEQTEQVNVPEVNNLTRLLDELSIIGVRPKPAGMTPKLMFHAEVMNNTIARQLLQQTLSERGFFLATTSDNQYRLVGKEGQLEVTTADGITYDLFFGEQFSGSLFEIEFGTSEHTSAPEPLVEDQAKAESAETDEAADKTEDEKSSSQQTGRYVFITARLNEEILGPPPTAPEQPATDASEEEKRASEEAQKSFNEEQSAYAKRLADAEQRVEELNERFGSWFYVLSTDNFENLRLTRNDLVAPKVEEATNTPPAMGTSDHPLSTTAPAAGDSQPRRPPVEAPAVPAPTAMPTVEAPRPADSSGE